MSKKRTFILGLGHQKCGTSWLHKYLCQSDRFAEGHTKEYHIWDKVDIPLFQDNLTNLDLRTALSSERMRSYRMENSEDYYFNYFDRLMSKDKLITADITPSYSGLRAERLEEIKQNFLLRDIEVKVVILARDPLSRIKSAVRFNLDRKNYSEGIAPNETDFEKALIQYYRTDHCLIRTVYQNILHEASKVFDKKDIYVGLFENMFDEGEVRRISDFLHIVPNFKFAEVRVNKTTNSVYETKSDPLIKDFYSGTYEFFYKNLPATNELWL